MCRVNIREFERFYNTEVKIIKKTESGGYTRKSHEVEELCTVKADIQPYGGGLAEKEYGFTVECQKRMFCADNPHITEGVYAIADNIKYKVVSVVSRSGGMTVLLQRVIV